ncbi:MAG: hypothetical protein MUD17_14195 [Gemmatimonadaceae bacterium]|nr:hypothetical protein [Gemmatimonadaceae bacterium]
MLMPLPSKNWTLRPGEGPAPAEDAQVEVPHRLPHAALEEAEVVVAAILLDDRPVVARHGAHLAGRGNRREQGGKVVDGKAREPLGPAGDEQLGFAHTEGAGHVAQIGGGVVGAIRGVLRAQSVEDDRS